MKLFSTLTMPAAPPPIITTFFRLSCFALPLGALPLVVILRRHEIVLECLQDEASGGIEKGNWSASRLNLKLPPPFDA